MYHLLTPLFADWDLHNKTVLMRVDYNMTYFQGKLLSDFKIRRTQKTLDYLLARGAGIKLITHQEPVDDTPMSTEPLITWFKNNDYTIQFSRDIGCAVAPKTITLCENIRFFPGEKSTDNTERAQLAHALRQHTDYYVFDGFGVAHRADTSVADVPLLFDPTQRSIGFLVADELAHLYPVIHNPSHPFVALCAGNKKEKLDSIMRISSVDTVLLAPLLCFNSHGEKIITPEDFIQETTIGPKTVAHWSTVLDHAQTILCNGLMGLLEKPESLVPFNTLISHISRSSAYSIIAGGSTTSYIDSLNRISDFSFCSTGGGATLAYLAQEKLPGLEVFL